MVYFRLNKLRDFSFGFNYNSRKVYNHYVYSLHIYLIIFTLSFVIYKYNS